MRRATDNLAFGAAELGLWAGLYGIYLLIRGVALGNVRDAFVHAFQVIDVERIAGLFHEERLQHAISSVDGARVFFDSYYMLGFGPLLGTLLVWLGLRHRPAYGQLRTAMLASLAIGTILFVLYPTAPPRLVPGLGIADTVGLSGHDTGSFAGIRFDPYAAMPSMHVGWSLLAAVVGVRVASRRSIRLLFTFHPALMIVAVTTTGNHYFLDSLAGVVVALLGLAVVSCRTIRLLQRGLGRVIPASSALASQRCQRLGTVRSQPPRAAASPL